MKRLLLLAVLFLFALVPSASANHAWSDYHWARASNPFTVSLSDHLTTADWHSRLSVVESDWSASSMLDVNTTSNGPVTVENADYGATNWVGQATIFIDANHHIVGGVVQANEFYLNQTAYSTWRQFVLCQEVGHIFGLEHQDENFGNTNLGTCMDYSQNPQGGGKNGSPNNEHPNQGDYDQLRCIYDPTVAGQTLSTSTHSCVGTGHLDSGGGGGKTKPCPPHNPHCTSGVSEVTFILPAHKP